MLSVSVVPSGVYGGHGAIFAPENLKDFSKNWRGWQWRGECASPSTQLVKNFLTSYN